MRSGGARGLALLDVEEAPCTPSRLLVAGRGEGALGTVFGEFGRDGSDGGNRKPDDRGKGWLCPLVSWSLRLT